MKFSSFRTLIEDRKVLLNLILANTSALVGIVAVGLFINYHNKIHVDEIAKVQLIHDRDVMQGDNSFKPISDISELAGTSAAGGSDLNQKTVLYGYFVNAKQICNQVESSGNANTTEKKQIVLLRSNGETVVGKADIGPKTCALLSKLNDSGKSLYTASDEPSFNSQRQYFSIQKQP